MDDTAILKYSADHVLDSLNDGLYVTDLERRIVFWSRAAERITGWRAAEVAGNFCHDNILCHTDKEGHSLCGKDRCPLHRAMVTGCGSAEPINLFARSREGRKIPVQVSVAPIRDGQGTIIGGVETFRDISAQMRDLERARTIQALSMAMPENDNPRLRFAIKYQPRDLIGGDFYTMEKLDHNRYAFCLVDVMGHGTAAGMYAMHLHSLWEANRRILDRPASFVSQLNKSLCRLVKDGESFAVGVFGYIDLRAQAVALCTAGSPMFFMRRQGRIIRVNMGGLPLGLVHGHVYEVTFLALEPGDGLLFCTDGATEISANRDGLLGGEGLSKLLENGAFPETEAQLSRLLEKILRATNSLEFSDDVTMLAISRPTQIEEQHAFAIQPAMAAAVLDQTAASRPDPSSAGGEEVLIPSTFTDIDHLISTCWEAMETDLRREGYETVSGKVHLALHEALINAWRHGNSQRPDLPIILRWHWRENFTFEVIDAGRGFSTAGLADPCAPERLTEESGRGLAIIRFCSDALRWENGGSHAIVSFNRP